MTAHRLLSVALLVLLAGCGTESAPAAEAPALPVVTVDGEVQVRCGYGGTSWSPSVMAEGIDSSISDDEVVGAFETLLADPQAAVELSRTFLVAGADETPWRVLAEDGTAFTLGLGTWTEDGPAGDRDHVLSMERTDDGWRWTGAGNCRLQPLLVEPKAGWVEVTNAASVKSDQPSLTMTLNEQHCTSARDPGPFLHEPRIVETDTSVTVYWTSTIPEGDSSCPGNPSVERTVELDSPLADRTVLDGSAWPPGPVTAR